MSPPFPRPGGNGRIEREATRRRWRKVRNGMFTLRLRKAVNAGKGDAVVFTANVRTFMGFPMLVVGDGKGFLIPEDSIARATATDPDGGARMTAYAVRIDGETFDPMRMVEEEMDGFLFGDSEDDLESLTEVAREQESGRTVYDVC